MLFALEYRTRKLLQMGLTNRRIVMVITGFGVIFASLGLGEAAYRMLFFDFDGATDRLPIELLFGFGFAYVAAHLVAKIYRRYQRHSVKMKAIRDRNRRIRHAVEAISPAPYPRNQQAIRVIREQVDRIDWELSEATKD